MVVSGPQQDNWTVLIGPGRPCQCDYATAYRSLCPCQLIADEGMFQIGKFAKRFHHLYQLEIVDRFDTQNSILEKETSILETKTVEGLSLMSADGFLGQCKNHLENSHHHSDTGEPKEKKQKMERHKYTDIMKYLVPLASLVAKHPQQGICIGALDGLYSLFQGENTADETTIQERYQNFLNQFSSNQNCGFFKNTKTDEQSVSTFRRKKTVGKPQKNRMMSATEMHATKPVGTGSVRTCRFYNETVSHSSKAGCSIYKQHKQYECDRDKVLQLATQVGNPERHKLLQCPPLIAKITQKREELEEKTQPWPMRAKT